LVSFGAGFTVEASHRNNLDWHALALRFEFNGVEYVRRVLLIGDKDSLHGPATGLEEF
jgi:hypothetical protein